MLKVIAPSFPDYKLLDSGDGKRLERFADKIIVRPDPNVLWPKSQPKHPGWTNPDALYQNQSSPKGWLCSPSLLEGWAFKYDEASFQVRPTPFRHMGIFPEQADNWIWLKNLINKRASSNPDKVKPKVLNLFAYTGAASILAALAGASVCHVDASKASIKWAKQNASLSGLSEEAIRWIVDDATKFLQREIRRGSRYDLIIMDPPVFGRGPKGEIWRLEERIAQLMSLTKELLSPSPLGVLLNFYATAIYPECIARVAQTEMAGVSLPQLELGSLNLEEECSKKLLCTGFFLRTPAQKNIEII